MSSEARPFRVIVVGAGVAGLAAAHACMYLLQSLHLNCVFLLIQSQGKGEVIREWLEQGTQFLARIS